MKKVIAIVSLTLVVALSGCARAPSNIWALSTEDCGSTWTVIPTGQAVPKHAIVCGYNMALPNWPMPGDAVFKTQFKGGVLTTAKYSYTYAIVDPLKFIQKAKYLGKMGSNSLEISSDTEGGKYEMAENMIIDKLLREVTTELTREMEIIDANPAEIEDLVFKAMTEELEKRGVAISDLALVIEADPQTRLAIDVAVAMRVYANAGIGDKGADIAKAYAGASKIIVNKEEASQSSN